MVMTVKRIVRRHGLKELTGLSLSTIHRLIRTRRFPAPIRLSTQAVGWDINDVHEWIEARKRGQQ